MWHMSFEDLMMLGHIRPGDLFWMTDVGAGGGWLTCIAIRHYNDPMDIPTSLVTLLAPTSCRIVETRFRSAKEVCVPKGWEWKPWAVER